MLKVDDGRIWQAAKKVCDVLPDWQGAICFLLPDESGAVTLTGATLDAVATATIGVDDSCRAFRRALGLVGVIPEWHGWVSEPRLSDDEKTWSIEMECFGDDDVCGDAYRRVAEAFGPIGSEIIAAIGRVSVLASNVAIILDRHCKRTRHSLCLDKPALTIWPPMYGRVVQYRQSLVNALRELESQRSLATLVASDASRKLRTRSSTKANAPPSEPSAAVADKKAAAINLPGQMVTLLQMASAVNRTKATLEKAKHRLPAPKIKGGKGVPSEWLWSDVRPILAEQFGRPDLPEVWPADRFRRR